MVANGARKTPTAPGSMGKQSLVDAHAADAVLKDKERKPLKIKLKQSAARQTQPGNWKESEIVDANNKKVEAPGGSTSPLVNSLNEHILAAFTTNRPLDDQLDTVQCRHCRRPVLRTSAKDHIKDCLDKKQAKLKKKKEAKEAKEAAIRREKGLPSEDEGPPKNARKSAKGALDDHTGAKKTKKRKADADAEKAPAKKKKKDEPKAKQAKSKGPVDVEKQCGVLLPNGSMCARSLTCKSHAMGAKRAVPGRSLPYDMLLAQYQKKNQAKQQRAAIDANAPLADDFDNHAPIDSDEEKDAIMAAIVRSRPAPLVTRPLIATRSKYQNVRIKEMLQQSMGGRNGSGLFSTGAPPPPPPSTSSTDPHTMPSSSSSSHFPHSAYRAAGFGLLGAIFGEPHQPPPLMTPGGASANSSSANATAAAAAAAAAGPGSAMGLGAGDDVAGMGLSSANAAAVAARRQSNMGNAGGGGGPRQILPGQLPGPSPNTSSGGAAGGGGGGGGGGSGAGAAGGGSRKTSLNTAGAMGGVNGVSGVGVG